MGEQGSFHGEQERNLEMERVRGELNRTFWLGMLVAFAYYSAVVLVLYGVAAVLLALILSLLFRIGLRWSLRPWWSLIPIAVCAVAVTPLYRLHKKMEQRLDEVWDRYEEAKCRQRERIRRERRSRGTER